MDKPMAPAAAVINRAFADRKPFPMQDEYWMIVSGCWKRTADETRGSLMSFVMTRDLDKNDSTTTT
jgi:hypothetical protein